MVKRRKAKLIFFSFSLAIILLLAVFMVFLVKGRERKVEIENNTFTESSRELQNPNRGFYRLYSFLITDKKQDYPQIISKMYSDDTDTKLALIRICLKPYRQGEITEKGLANIEALFEALEGLDKRLIVRFTYDDDGKNERYEPEDMDIILAHMEQVSHILHAYSDKIFCMQGLFIGNWGEMHGTQYDSDEDLQRLAWQLGRVTEPTTYLAVRVPAQWRSIMQSGNTSLSNLLSGRLGLFNDGMLGNESDYGTYSTGKETDTDIDTPLFPRLERKEELEFQNKLCREVPNGGEVINDNVYNDLDNAVKDFSAMHITYLNKVYDQAVMDKWAQTVVTEEGCFKGMDGLSYIERHLGYRLVIVSSSLRYRSKDDTLTAEVTLQNVGFAPVYKETKIRMILCNEKNEETLVYPVYQELSGLAGGDEKEDTLTLSVNIPFRELEEKAYTVYFSAVDSDTGELILLANEEEEETYGYQIGRFSQR